MSEVVTDFAERQLPELNDRNRHFWSGGRDGKLHILRCRTCGLYLHPPKPVCPRCYKFDLAPEAVSGKGVVHSFTVNHYQWFPDFPPPYVVAEVELVEQPGLRLMTNIVGCAPETVSCGSAVEVVFAVHGDIYVPLFRPVPA